MMQNISSPMMSPGNPQKMNPGASVPSMDELQQGQNPQEKIKTLAHMNPEEVKDFDMMMGGPNIDPETGLRDLSPLEDVFKNPEVQQAIAQALSVDKNKSFADGGRVEEVGRPIIPELEELRQEGTGDDTELVIITPELEKMFTEWSGGKTKTNKFTGFPEFNFFRTFIRIAAPVIGGLFAGPIGAALGGGLGTRLTGGSWRQSLGAAALGGIGAHVLGGAGFPGLQGSFGGGLSNLFGGASRVGLGAAAAGGAGASGAAGAGAGAGGGFLSNLLSMPSLIGLGGAGYLAYRGHQDERRQREQNERRQRQEDETMRQRLGFDRGLRNGSPYELTPNTTPISPEDLAAGRQHQHFTHTPHYSDGGAIKGIGKGQQDNIPKDIKKNSYIIDASSVSDIGDGSTQAGFEALNKYFSKIHSHNSSQRSEAKGGFIKAMVSDGEYEVSPEIVTAIGKGSNDKGAKILEQFIKQVRKQKRTTGDKLPPKSKPIGGYLKQLHAA